MTTATPFKALFALPLLVAFAACGGGGGSGSVGGGPPPVTPTPVPTSPPIPVGDSTAPAYRLTDDSNKSVGDPSTASIFASSANGRPDNQPVDGLPCGGSGPLAQHVHGHVTVIDNGTTVIVPSGIGMFLPVVVIPANFRDAGPGGCDYDIHIHSNEAVLHIESTSATQTFNLKDLFDIWGQTITANSFGPLVGQTRIFVTDQSSQIAGSYTVTEVTGRDLTTVPLTKHLEVTVEVGPTFVPVPNYIWGAGLF